MCKQEYINIQTGEVLNNDIVRGLPENSILNKRPDLWMEWDFEKNDKLGLDIYKVTKGLHNDAWWIGKCGHGWLSKIYNRHNNKVGCPYCSKAGAKTLKGFNDMATTNPKLASLTLNKEDSYKYMQFSDVKIDWRCKCGNIIRNKAIKKVNIDGLGCPKCSDGVSFGEKIIYNLLKSMNIKFKKEKRFEWLSDRIYDFYIPSLNMIIEVHGIQHYKQTARKGARTLEEEQINDLFKYQSALQNGIKTYVVIDGRKSDIEWMKNSILNSELCKYIDLKEIDWGEILEQSSDTLVKEVCRLYNKGVKIKDINSITSVCNNTITKYLKMGHEVGWCNYINKGRFTKLKREIVQLSKCGELIKKWETIKDASNNMQVQSSAITQCCMGRSKTSAGFKWMYIEDYNKYIEESNSKTA